MDRHPSLVGHKPWGSRELDITKRVHAHTHTHTHTHKLSENSRVVFISAGAAIHGPSLCNQVNPGKQ